MGRILKAVRQLLSNELSGKPIELYIFNSMHGRVALFQVGKMFQKALWYYFFNNGNKVSFVKFCE